MKLSPDPAKTEALRKGLPEPRDEKLPKKFL